MKKQFFTIMSLVAIFVMSGCTSDDESIQEELLPQEELRQDDSQKDKGRDEGKKEDDKDQRGRFSLITFFG